MRHNALTIGLLAFGLTVAASAVGGAEARGAEWKISIIPRKVEPQPPEFAAPAKIAAAKAYGEIYRSILFIRSLQDVDPLYRHELTMRILFSEPLVAPNVEEPPPPGKPMKK